MAAATAGGLEAIIGNTIHSTGAERRTATNKPQINSEELPEGHQRPTVRPVPAKIFLSGVTGHKQARATRVLADNRPATAMPVHADSKPVHATPAHGGNSQAPGIVPVAAETVGVEAEEIGLAIAAHLPAQVPGEVLLVADRAG